MFARFYRTFDQWGGIHFAVIGEVKGDTLTVLQGVTGSCLLCHQMTVELKGLATELAALLSERMS